MTDVPPPPLTDGHRGPKRPAISFEFFPPKTEEMERNLWDTIKRLAPLAPNFVSVTYGAGGSTRERTHATIARILKETDLLPAAHLTCVGASRGEIDDIVDRYHDLGVRHIVALRGDPATGIGNSSPTRKATRPRPSSSQGSRTAIRISRCPSRPIPKSIPRRATSMPTSTR
jgi:methylenetetrahydrofolate reductase (NADPH)